jgi:hypothetical protein
MKLKADISFLKVLYYKIILYNTELLCRKISSVEFTVLSLRDLVNTLMNIQVS